MKPGKISTTPSSVNKEFEISTGNQPVSVLTTMNEPTAANPESQRRPLVDLTQKKDAKSKEKYIEPKVGPILKKKLKNKLKERYSKTYKKRLGEI